MYHTIPPIKCTVFQFQNIDHEMFQFFQLTKKFDLIYPNHIRNLGHTTSSVSVTYQDSAGSGPSISLAGAGACSDEDHILRS